MTTSAVQPRSAAAPSGDPCCCDGHHDSRCSIECLVEPRFFCGQLLTDDDLTTVVGWARQRLGLARHRHGWGVACGLDVVCDPEHPGRILVHPGYAVDRCGEDVVACDPLQYDLAAVCSPPPGDCTDVYQQQPTPERYTAVDLYGYHVAEDAEPQLALAGGTCREPTVCEPSRTKQRLELRAEPAAPERDPVEQEYQWWAQTYASATAFLRQVSGVADPRGFLLRLLDAEPLQDLPFARRLLADTGTGVTEDPQRARVLFWIAQDRRNAVLGCPCPSGGPGQDIPLARVWVDRGENGRGCTVWAVDAAPPYRRPLGPDRWPAELGSLNLGRLIWRRPEEVCVELAALGVPVTDTVTWAPTTLDDLVALVKDPPVVRCGQAVAVVVLEPGGERPNLGRRVVAIRPAASGQETDSEGAATRQATAGGPSGEPSAGGSPEPAQPGRSTRQRPSAASGSARAGQRTRSGQRAGEAS